MNLPCPTSKMPPVVGRNIAAEPLAPACAEADAAQKIRQSISFMQEHLDQPLQVAALAASVNVSQSHYFALFKRIMGSTPIDYFIHLRMQRACHLLRTTSASVKCVAAALGYDDPFYFSRVFRAVNGVAPSGYRSQNGAAELLTADFIGTSRPFTGNNGGGFMLGTKTNGANQRRELSM